MKEPIGRIAILKRCVYASLETNIGRDDEFQVSKGMEFQSMHVQMNEKVLWPRDVQITITEMERRSESDDLVDTECDRKLLQSYAGRSIVSVFMWENGVCNQFVVW